MTRPERARYANDRIAAEARRQHFVSRLPMLCECDDPGCSAIFLIHGDAYGQLRADPRNVLTAPGHRLDGARLEAHEGEYSVYRIR